MQLLTSESEFLPRRLPLPAPIRRPSILTGDPALRKRPYSRLPSDVLASLQPKDRSVSLFQVLAEVCRTQVLTLRVPETLDIKAGVASQTLLYTRADGFLSFYRGI